MPPFPMAAPPSSWVPPTTESLEVALPSSENGSTVPVEGGDLPQKWLGTQKKSWNDWNILVTLKKIEHNLPLTISVGFEQSLFLLVIYFTSHTKRNPMGMEYQHISEPWVLGDWAFEPLNNKITIHRESHGFGASPCQKHQEDKFLSTTKKQPWVLHCRFHFEVWNQLSNTVLLGHFWSKSWFLGTCWVAPVFIFDMVQYWCAFHSLMLLWAWNQWHRLRNNMHCTCSKAISSQVKLGRS